MPHEYLEVSKPCGYCKEVFTKTVNIANKTRLKFCSRSCKLKLRRVNRYGTTKEILLDMIKDQNNCCAICKKAFDYVDIHGVNIDHCHKTGKVRGLLCVNCNQGLGQFKENIVSMKEAIKYLEKNL